MNRFELESYILDNYNAINDYPWAKTPSFEVFRHINRKWFAVIMEIEPNKLGLLGNDIIQVVNLKCSQFIMSGIVENRGIFPAYHMNKQHWITVALDGSVSDEQLKMLVDVSYNLTIPTTKKSTK